MNRLNLGILLLATITVVGCATEQPPPILSGRYLEPIDSSEKVSNIRGILTEHMLNTNRVRLLGADGHNIPKGPRVPLPVKFTAGKHNISIICEWEKTSGEAYASLDVDLMGGHNYIVACDELGSIINAGTEFRFFDELAPDQIIAKTTSWGANRGPKSSF